MIKPWPRGRPRVVWHLDRERGVIVFTPHLPPIPYLLGRRAMRARVRAVEAALIGAARRALLEAAADPEVRAFYADDPVALRNLDGRLE
jgi:hypothetical protein